MTLDSESLGNSNLRPELPLVVIESRAEWRRWLSLNHTRKQGVWVVTVKKAARDSDQEFVSARDLNEECLCFGWIDSKPGSIDDRRSALLCTPRKSGSGWSKVNKTRIAQLKLEGLMTAAGQAAIDAAVANGSWESLDAVDALVVPEDLKQAFREHPPAMERFAAFPPSARKSILEWINGAKTDATRSKRIGETAVLAKDNIRVNQWKRPTAPER